MSNSRWYKKTAMFGSDPFGGSELSDKTRTSPMGNAGGDSHFGLFEPSDSNHHANDVFSESNEMPSVEKSLQELKKKIDRKRGKKRRLKKNYASNPPSRVVVSQWGQAGPRIPSWDESATGSDWVSKTYNEIEPDGDKAIPDPSQNQPNPVQEIIKSTVMIEMKKGNNIETGSGFFVNENIILTCSHVVVPKDGIEGSSITITTDYGKFMGYVWAFDPSIDIAAIVVNDDKFKKGVSLKLGNSTQVNIGDQIMVIGSPLGFQNIVSQGIISSKPVDYQSGDSKNNYIFISSNIFPGNSGGPVIDSLDNSVIGIAAAVITPDVQAQNGLSATIPIDVVKPFLKKNGIKFDFSGRGQNG